MILTTDWLRQNHTQAHAFGLGFIQVKLNDTERVHFWHPEFKREREEAHNHRYNFVSEILRGSMYHEILEFKEDPAGDHQLFDTDCSPEKPGSEPQPLATGYLYHTFAGTLSMHTRYDINHKTFHRIEADYCITHLMRSKKLKTHAQVVRLIGEPVVCPFAEKVSQDQVWQMVDDCIVNRF